MLHISPAGSVTKISIKTGDRWRAGTDCHVKLKICDGTDKCCETADDLDNQGDDRERGSLDVYTDVRQLEQCATVARLTLREALISEQARKLQATLPVRNYDRLTYLLADGGEV